MVTTPGSGDLTDKIRFRLGHIADVRPLEEAIHAQAIRVGNEIRAIRVSNIHMAALPRRSMEYIHGGLSTPEGPPGLITH